MKKLLIIALIVPLALISCGKSEEVKIVVNPPVVEEQVTITPPVVATGSVVENNTGKIEAVSTGVVLENRIESDSGLLTTDTWKVFNIDDYLKKGTYTILHKENKWDISVYIVHPGISKEKENCLDDTYCASFITKKWVLAYTNMKEPWNIEYKNLKDGQTNDLFDSIATETPRTNIYENGVVFLYDGWAGWMECSGWRWWDFIYVNIHTGKKILERSGDWQSCEWFNDKIDTVKYWCEKACKKIIKTKNQSFNDPENNELNLKATNIEDAYFEYYKEVK